MGYDLILTRPRLYVYVYVYVYLTIYPLQFLVQA